MCNNDHYKYELSITVIGKCWGWMIHNSLKNLLGKSYLWEMWETRDEKDQRKCTKRESSYVCLVVEAVTSIVSKGW